jgi:hypothetical protein
MWRVPTGRWRGGLVAGVAALAVLAQLPTLDRSAVPVDEGQLVSIADRLLRGEVLYRDVYTGIYPGIYYATALLLDVFGHDVLVTRWAQALVNAATVACLGLLGLRVMGPAWAALAPVLYLALVIVGFPGLTMFNYSPLALVFALFALLFLLRYLESARPADGIAVGLLLGACGIVKQNFGGLGVLAVGLGLVWGRRGGPLAPRSLVAAFLPILASGAALGVGVLGAFAAAGALPDLFHATVLAMGESQMDAFSDPFPPIFGPHPNDDPRFVFMYTPAALFNYLVRGETIFGASVSPLLRGASIRLAYGGTLATLLAGALLLWLERAGGSPERRRATRAVLVFALLFFLGIFPSAIWSHLAFILAPVLLVLGLVGDRVSSRIETRSQAAAWGWKGLFAALVLGALVLGWRISVDLRRWYPEPLGLARATLRVSQDQRALLRGATRFLEHCARPGEPVFVAPDIPLVYFLANRRNPTPFDLVIPGDVSGPLIVERLAQTGTRCVVYNPKMYLQFAPFDELFPEVARHLETAYRRAAVIRGQDREWYGLVRQRKPGP